MRESVIRASNPEADEHGITWTGSFTPPGDEPAVTTFRFGSPTGGGPPPSARPFVLAFLPAAMRVGAPVRIDGPIDGTTLASLLEWQEAMAAWHPGEFQVVSLRADAGTTPSVAAPSDAPRGAVSAFSGGVDSCFTAVRHRPGAAIDAERDPQRRTEVRAGLFVHGFDIARDDEDTYLAARTRVSGILEGLAIEPMWLQTDIRALERRWPLDWETTSHGIWLAAALACVEHWFDLAIIPSTFSYPVLELPWGSNPITDPLLGSDRVPMWHDGAAFNKAAKVRALAGHRSVEAGLRVCWSGDRLDRNCGRCMKCVATQVCFWMYGVDEPACFDAGATVADLAKLRVRKPYQRPILDQIRRAALDAGRPDIADACAQVVAR